MDVDVVAERVGVGADAEGGVGSTTLIGRHRQKMDMCCCSRVAGAEAAGGVGSSADAPPPLVRVFADGDVQARLAGTFDVVVDATGSPQGLAAASELCRPMG